MSTNPRPRRSLSISRPAVAAQRSRTSSEQTWCWPKASARYAGVDIPKRHKDRTGRVVKVHDDRFWADVPVAGDLSEVPAAVLRWCDQCRSDRWHKRTAAQRQGEAQHQQQVS